MINKKGISSLSNFSNNSKGGSSSRNNTVFQARVMDIILNEDHPLFTSYWGLGTIIYDKITGDQFNKNSIITKTNNNILYKAKPFSLHNTIYPVIDENVFIISCVNPLANAIQPPTVYFYISTCNLNNHPYHNAIPVSDFNLNYINSNQSKDYVFTSNTKIPSNPNKKPTITPPRIDSPTNPTQNTFLKTSNIKPLQPFMGDIIYQGRFGNSIRFSSTSNPPSSNPLNSWSESGDNGNPITIIRNGQPPESSNIPNIGFDPTIEDINKDLSSIWQTSTQKIPIEVSSKNYNSYSTPPESPSQYTKPQVIINSDRLVFNAKTDSILLSAEKSVGLSSNESLNFNTKNYIVDAGSIKLGSKDATEPLVKGETLYKNLTQIVDALRTLVDVMEVQQLWPGGVATPDGGTAITARTTKDILNNVKKDLVNIKSSVSKTI